MKRTLLTMTALIALTCATSAHAGLTMSNGLSTNGLSTNSLTTNAISGNSLTTNAITQNGLDWNALTDNALGTNSARTHDWAGEQPVAYLPVPVVVFAITLPDGSVLAAAPTEF